MRIATLVGAVLAVTLEITAARAQSATDVRAVSEPVLRQLEAFNRNDYDAAYAFASSQIRQLFDRAAFERLVKSGYPEIAASARARIADHHVAPDGHVFLLLKIRGANGRHVEAVYEMVWEADTWKINGVVAQPDPGEEARARWPTAAAAIASPMRDGVHPPPHWRAPPARRWCRLPPSL